MTFPARADATARPVFSAKNDREYDCVTISAAAFEALYGS